MSHNIRGEKGLHNFLGPAYKVDSLCNHLLISGALCSLPNTTNKHAKVTLLLYACPYSLRLVANLFIPCQWNALTFMISCDFLSINQAVFIIFIL